MWNFPRTVQLSLYIFEKTRTYIHFPCMMHHGVHVYWIWDMIHSFLLEQPDGEQVSLRMPEWYPGPRMRGPWLSSAYTDQRTNARYIGIAFWVYCFNVLMEIQYFSTPNFTLMCKLRVPVSPALNTTSLQPQDLVDTWFIFRHGEWNTSAV